MSCGPGGKRKRSRGMMSVPGLENICEEIFVDCFFFLFDSSLLVSCIHQFLNDLDSKMISTSFPFTSQFYHLSDFETNLRVSFPATFEFELFPHPPRIGLASNFEAMKPMEPSKHVHLQRRELIEKYHRLYARSRSLEDGQMKDGHKNI